MKKYNVNKDFFKTWSNTMAYILGYIYADGNIDKSKYRMRISSIDIQILEDINAIIENTCPIKEEHNKLGKWWTLKVDNQEMYKDLVVLGITPNKSLNCKLQYVPKEYVKDFVRGFFDRDGCVYAKWSKESSIPTLSIDIATGSEVFKNGLVELLSICTDSTHKFSVQYRKNSNVILIRGNSVVSERFYQNMYYKNCICLKRKKDKFEEILSARAKRKIKVSKAHIV